MAAMNLYQENQKKLLPTHMNNMAGTLYLDGHPSENALYASLETVAELFILKYCKMTSIHSIFVRDHDADSDEATYVCCPRLILHNLTYDCIEKTDLPVYVACCKLPVIQENDSGLVRSGLCSTVRHLVSVADSQKPEEQFVDLLGFREASLRSCAETSSWTKLCEVEFPEAVCIFRNKDIHCKCVDADQERELGIPAEFLKLEKYMNKPPLLHNGRKIKRDVLKWMKNRHRCMDDIKYDSGGNNTPNVTLASLEKDMFLPHGVLRYNIVKKGTKIIKDKLQKQSPNCVTDESPMCDVKSEHVFAEQKYRETKPHLGTHNQSNSFKPTLTSSGLVQPQNRSIAQEMVKSSGDYIHLDSNQASLLGANDVKKQINGDCQITQLSDQLTSNKVIDNLAGFLKRLTIDDIRLEHLYVEGIALTIADLIIIVFMFYFLEASNLSQCLLKHFCPSLTTWYKHMITLPRVEATAKLCGIDLEFVIKQRTSNCHYRQLMPDLSQPTEDIVINDAELSHYSNSKHRAIKPDVEAALQKLQINSIVPDVGTHPCGSKVTLDWPSYPADVHPVQGELPMKRLMRKCQQLENLASAVLKIAKPGDIIVDFCCGGGHLGIVLAYLLPTCQVYLIENKEDSLLIAQKRVNKLQLSNIHLFQSNLDYFHGHFNIGLSLHACGVATDLVLQQCLKQNAAFVICPCCYGSIQNTHLITYPRSRAFLEASISYKNCLTLGHAADMTEFGIELEETGKYCMNLFDWDRALLAKETGFDVTLCSLQPQTCTPKNNLLIGIPTTR